MRVSSIDTVASNITEVAFNGAVEGKHPATWSPMHAR